MDSTTRNRPVRHTQLSVVDGNRRIALASQSPRRLEILQKFGFSAEVVPSRFDERKMPRNVDPRNHVLAAARGKALGASHALPIVAGDTIVVIDGEILGQPKNLQDAERMLHRLSGRWHEVFSGVALRYRSGMLEAMDRSGVRFKPLTEGQIRDYIATGEPMGKAGAYAIQGQGSQIIEEYTGSYWNIVGFPIEAFIQMWEALLLE